MTGQKIMGAVVRVYETSNNTGTNITYDLKIPDKLSNCLYSVTQAGNRLVLECVEGVIQRVDTPAYNFNIKIKNNIIYSSNGLIRITVKNGEIVLE